MDDFDTPPTVFIPRTEFALTAPFVGRRSVLEQATPGRQLRSAGEGIGTRIVWIASPNDFTAAPPMLLYRCALNGWRVRRVVPVERPYPLEDRRDPGNHAQHRSQHWRSGHHHHHPRRGQRLGR